MCGINGFNFYQPDLIAKMNQRIKHRGPDQEGIYCDDNFSLGHVRLSIIDVSEKAKQPLFNVKRCPFSPCTRISLKGAFRV